MEMYAHSDKIDNGRMRQIIAEKIRVARLSAGVRQQDLASRAGVDVMTIVHAEDKGGTHHLISMQTLLCIAQGLNVEAGELLPTLAEMKTPSNYVPTKVATAKRIHRADG